MTPPASVTPSAASRGARATGATRIDGIDAARALAFAGMVFAHYVASNAPGGPRWLRTADDAFDGRAAPLFCLLLGLGAGLLAAGGAPGSTLVRRGAALFVLGALLWPVVDQVYIILPHYAVLLIAVPLLRRLATSALLPAAALAFALPSTVTASTDVAPLRSAAQPDRYGDVFDAVELGRHLFWTGGYPLVGWVGFALVGLWVARLPLRRRRTAWALLAGGSAIALAQPAVEALHRQAVDAGSRWAVFADTTPHSNQTAWYVLASGTAVAALAACLLLAAAAPSALRPWRDLGRFALSAYVAHLLLGVVLVWPWQESMPALVWQAMLAVGVTALLAVAAGAWLRRFGRGPLEAVVRLVAP